MLDLITHQHYGDASSQGNSMQFDFLKTLDVHVRSTTVVIFAIFAKCFYDKQNQML
jgi:hypothetical protein